MISLVENTNLLDFSSQTLAMQSTHQESKAFGSFYHQSGNSCLGLLLEKYKSTTVKYPLEAHMNYLI